MRAADDDAPTLPEDAAELRALLLETRALVDTLVAGRDALASRNERLHHLLLKPNLPPPPDEEPPDERPGGRTVVPARRRAELFLSAFLTSAWHPDGPYLHLALSGEEGAAKSTAGRTAKR